MEKRKLEIVVISDVHLGSYGCRAKELVHYLSSIDPELLILNGDIIEGWQFNKHYFPKSHRSVIRCILDMAARGVKVVYLTGNHDEMLRRFSPFQIGNFQLVDQVLLEIDEKKAWIFHGDVFDVSIRGAKWLAKLGGRGYEWLMLLNMFVNWVLARFGKPKFSFSKWIKDGVKRGVKRLNDFEQASAEVGIERGVDFVICGHVHQPQIRTIETSKNRVLYLNSGDWLENASALEYSNREWSLYFHEEAMKTGRVEAVEDKELPILDDKTLSTITAAMMSLSAN